MTPEAELRLAPQVASLDWGAITTHLDAYGYALMPSLFTTRECRSRIALYEQDGMFRSRALVARHGFGRGEYRYFDYPLPAG